MLHTLQVDMKSFPKSSLRHAISNGSSARDIIKMSKRTSYNYPITQAWNRWGTRGTY